MKRWEGERLGSVGGRPGSLLQVCREGFSETLFKQRLKWRSDFTFTFHFHALEKEMAAHSSVLAWRIPGTGERGGLPSMGSHRVGHDWSGLAAAAALNGRGLHGKVDQGRGVCVCVCWGRVTNGRGLHGMVVQPKKANRLTRKAKIGRKWDAIWLKVKIPEAGKVRGIRVGSIECMSVVGTVWKKALGKRGFSSLWGCEKGMCDRLFLLSHVWPISWGWMWLLKGV